MKYQTFSFALKAVSAAVSCAFKMGAAQRYGMEKARAMAAIAACEQQLSGSREDQSMAGILQECIEVLDRIESIVEGDTYG